MLLHEPPLANLSIHEICQFIARLEQLAFIALFNHRKSLGIMPALTCLRESMDSEFHSQRMTAGRIRASLCRFFTVGVIMNSPHSAVYDPESISAKAETGSLGSGLSIECGIFERVCFMLP
jgi:hypothetical protein